MSAQVTVLKTRSAGSESNAWLRYSAALPFDIVVLAVMFGWHIATAVIGALVVTLADLLGRMLFAPIQIPAGLVTAIIGVPVFIILLQRAQAKSSL